MTLKCENGVLDEFSTMRWGVVTESKNISCEYFSFYSWKTSCNNKDDFRLDYENNCYDRDSCTLNISSLYFDLGCSYYEGPETNFYFKALCKDIEIQIIFGFKIDKSLVGYIVAGCDALLSLLFVLMLLL